VSRTLFKELEILGVEPPLILRHINSAMNDMHLVWAIAETCYHPSELKVLDPYEH